MEAFEFQNLVGDSGLLPPPPHPSGFQFASFDFSDDSHGWTTGGSWARTGDVWQSPTADGGTTSPEVSPIQPSTVTLEIAMTGNHGTVTIGKTVDGVNTQVAVFTASDDLPPLPGGAFYTKTFDITDESYKIYVYLDYEDSTRCQVNSMTVTAT
jgi:hypothetical protein